MRRNRTSLSERPVSLDGEREAADRAPAAPSALTPRQKDVAALLVGTGLSYKQIAAHLGISHRTVETHRESLMDKLNIRTVAGLTKLVLGEGVAE